MPTPDTARSSPRTLTLLRQNTEIIKRVRKLSEEVNNLTRGIHEKVVKDIFLR